MFGQKRPISVAFTAIENNTATMQSNQSACTYHLHSFFCLPLTTYYSTFPFLKHISTGSIWHMIVTQWPPSWTVVCYICCGSFHYTFACRMTDTQESVVINQNTIGQILGFLWRLKKSCIESEWFIPSTIRGCACCRLCRGSVSLSDDLRHVARFNSH